jgi:hypothetical protein
MMPMMLVMLMIPPHPAPIHKPDLTTTTMLASCALKTTQTSLPRQGFEASNP